MQKIIITFIILLSLHVSSVAQPPQGTVEMDAIAFVRDSGKIQAEIYYSIIQGALRFEQKGNIWTAPINVRAELWQDRHVIAARDIKKEKVFSGTKSSLDNASGSLILDGTVLTANIKSNDVAVLIFQSVDDKGKQLFDTIKRNIFVPVISKEIFYLSGVELANSLTSATDHSSPFEKVGYVIIPNPSKVFSTSNSKLNYYTELYIPMADISSSERCEVITQVLDGQKHEMFSNSHGQQLAATTIPLVGSIDVDGLPTDSYTLEIEIKRGGKVVAAIQKVFFYDSGMKLSEEQNEVPSAALDEESIYLSSDISRMTDLELEEKGEQAMYIGKNEQAKAWKKLKQKLELAETPAAKEAIITDEKRFLFNFWRTKDKEQAASSPLSAYRTFYRHVDDANKKFTYQKTPGWETDFGRIYLTYGAPDERNIRSELHSVDAKPYIVWQYNDINIHVLSSDRSPTEATKVIINYNYPTFIFVDKQGGGKFVLVHSNVQGEVYETDWYIQEAATTH